MSIPSELAPYANELAPFFRFATPQNPSAIVHQWISRDGKIMEHRIFQNCVCCNTQRFNNDELDYQRLGKDTNFCDPCFQKVAKIVKKYDVSPPDVNYRKFEKVWNQALFKSCL